MVELSPKDRDPREQERPRSIEEGILAKVTEILRAESKGEIDEAGVLAAIRAELFLPELTEREEWALGRAGADEDSDWMARIVSARMQRALEAGLRHAGRKAGERAPPEEILPGSESVASDEDESLEGTIAEILDNAVPGSLQRLEEQLGDSLRASHVAPPGEGAGGGLPSGEDTDWIRSTLRKGGDDDDPLVGTLFHDKYRILRKIGAGGFGAVYEALDERGAMNRVAIKIMLPGATRTRAMLEAFRGEAVRVTRLNHPNIVDWKNFDLTPEGHYYFVMELLEGEELHRILERERAMKADRAVQLMLQILDALRAAHFVSEEESILHLDLKPKNIIVLPPRKNRPESVKVIDFGIGQYVGGDDSEVMEAAVPEPVRFSDAAADHQALSTVCVRTGVDSDCFDAQQDFDFKLSLACTPEYASPEQCEHIDYASRKKGDPRPLDGRSDLYSFGVVAYRMLTGRLPFATPERRYDYLELHRTQAIERWKGTESQIPRPLRRFVERCLNKDPDQRWSDVNEAFERLRKIAYPPVWRNLVKVAAPLVIAGGALATVYWPRGAEAASRLALQGPDGELNIETPLYMGPEKRELSLYAFVGDGSSPLAPGAALALVDDKGEEPFAGWTVARGVGGLAILRAPEDFEITPAGYGAWTVRLRGSGELGGAEPFNASDPFRLVWLGGGSWDVAVRIGGELLSEDTIPTIDPIGLSVELWLSGPARGDLLSPEVRFGETALQRYSQSLTVEEIVQGYSLDTSSWKSGETSWRISVEDPAGGSLQLQGTVSIETLPLVIEAVRILESESKAIRKPSDGEYFLHREDEYLLRVETNRASRLSLKLDDGEWSDPTSEDTGHDIELGLVDGFSNIDGEGHLAIRVTDSVINVNPGAHEGGRDLPFFVKAGRERVSLSLRSDSDTLPREDSKSPYYSGAERLTLVIEPHSRFYKTIEVLRRPQGGEVDRIETLPDVRDAEQPVLLPQVADGVYTILVRTHPQKELGSAPAREWDDEQAILLVVDTRAPVVSLVPSIEGRLVTTGTESIEVRLVPEDRLGSPLSLQWALRGPDDLLETGVVGEGELKIDLPVILESTGRLDGAYELIVSGGDRAGNEMQPLSWSFERALDPPKLSLVHPKIAGFMLSSDSPQLWAFEKDGTLLIEAHVQDPNAVAAVRCSAYREFRQEEEEQTEILEHSGLGKLGVDGRWKLRPPIDWSGATDVHLRFELEDGHGVAAQVDLGPFRIRRIEPPPFPRVRIDLPGHDVNAMKLVHGNEDYPYFFGGRNVRDERLCFKKARFDHVKWVTEGTLQSGGRSPWGLEFPPREIEDFYLDEQEVGVAQFLEFLHAEGGYSSTAVWAAGIKPDPQRLLELRRALEEQSPSLPVTEVTWEEADAYARWVGKRLPTLLEFEFAVRGGSDYRPFSCFQGSPIDPKGGAVVTRSNRSAPRPCDAGVSDLSLDRTPDTNLRDLGGNVTEWTQTPYLRYQHRDRVPFLPWDTSEPAPDEEFWAAGGSFDRTPFDFTQKESHRKNTHFSHIGFRCAVSAREAMSRLNPPGGSEQPRFIGD